MAGRILLVTGGSRGIGAAVAKLAAQRGYTVATAARNPETGRRQAYRADVSRPEEVEKLFAAVARDLGPVAALVNSAGIAGPRSPLADLDPAAMREVVDVNLLGTAYCCRAAARQMARSAGGAGGAIVNVSSDAARTGGDRLSLYAAAKAGVNALTVALARELARDGIRVNAVSPGIVATDQHSRGVSDETLRSIALGRPGAPAEVAEAILWLLSDEASYVTGAVLPVHGGR